MNDPLTPKSEAEMAAQVNLGAVSTALDSTVQHIGTLELREELPVIVREQVQTGQISFRRDVQTRSEVITMELRRETLHIEVGPGEAAVYFGDELLSSGETREILLYDEQIVVSKAPYVTEEVRIGKRMVTEIQETALNLGYEVLVTEKSETAKLDTATSDTPLKADVQLPAQNP